MYTIRIGCQLDYFAAAATPSVFIVQPPVHPRQLVLDEKLEVTGAVVTGEYLDAFGNRCQRVTLAPGDVPGEVRAASLRFAARAVVPPAADEVRAEARAIPPHELPSALLRYTLPSRYAETDELLQFAWDNFAKIPAGYTRARAICEWVHRNIEYQRGSSRPDWSAADVIEKRRGVCRDRAHVVVALCRAFNMPARYAVAYLPDIEVPDDGVPMDFHAYAEVFLEGGWQVFDPHRLEPRKGRVFIATGLDAADAAFATLYGAASLTRFRVWADAEPLGAAAVAPAAAASVAAPAHSVTGTPLPAVTTAAPRPTLWPMTA